MSTEAMYNERTRPAAKRTARGNPSKTLADVQAEISEFRVSGDANFLPWRGIAQLTQFYGVPAATLCAIYKHGREPRNNEYRRILGLPALGVGEICPVHGKVCAVKHRLAPAARKPRTSYKALWALTWAAWLGKGQR